MFSDKEKGGYIEPASRRKPNSGKPESEYMGIVILMVCLTLIGAAAIIGGCVLAFTAYDGGFIYFACGVSVGLFNFVQVVVLMACRKYLSRN